MLVVSRRESETIQVTTSDGPITIMCVEVRRDKARIGIVAPPTCEIVREEVLDKPCPRCVVKYGLHRVAVVYGRTRRVCDGTGKGAVVSPNLDAADGSD